MKRADLIRLIEQGGCVLVRHGGKYDWYRNPATGVSQPVPRHREVKEPLSPGLQQWGAACRRQGQILMRGEGRPLVTRSVACPCPT